MENIVYDFDSGDLSLDFANTMDWHGSEKPVEKLKDYSDLVNWGKQAGLISPESAKALLKDEAANSAIAESAYELAIQLREAIYNIFSNLYAGNSVPAPDLNLLNHLVRQAMSQLQLVPKDGGLSWEWAPGDEGAMRILLPVARAAAELLTSERAGRVRECEDDRGCGYLFIDQTKNHSRRWCSMESCGNRAKARRHYSRLQAN